MSQKSLYDELQNVSVCTIVLSFHLPTWCKKDTGSGLKKCLCEHTYLVLFPYGEEQNAHEWTEKMSVHAHYCSCCHAVQEKNTQEWAEKMFVCAH